MGGLSGNSTNHWCSSKNILVQDVRPVLVSGGDIDGLIAFPNLLFNNISRPLNASDDVSPGDHIGTKPVNRERIIRQFALCKGAFVTRSSIDLYF